MRAHHRISLSLFSITVALASAAWANPEYRVTVVGPAESYGNDINNAGVVVGTYAYSGSTTHGFLNRGAGLVDLGPRTIDAVAINDKGHVLGHWTTVAGQRRGFIYHGGSAHDIGVIPGQITTYTDINYGGYITAYGQILDSMNGPHSYLRAPDGTFTDIGSLPFDNPMTNAYAINNHKQIVGSSGPLVFPDQPLRAFIWNKGIMSDLGDFGFDPNVSLAINDCGQVTGYASLPEGFRNEVAFLYSKGRMVNIDGRPPTTDRYSGGTGINCHGHVVGYSNHLSGFIYRGRKMESLNALIDPKAGWDVYYPRAINNAGQIAATAYRGKVRYAVRLDLIRPLSLRLPDEAATDDMGAPQSEAQRKAEQELDAKAQASEVTRPVQQ